MPKVSFKNKDHILTVASRMFARKGYRATTMEAIAKACGMNKASLYYYFPSKRELYREVLKSIYMRVSESFSSSMAKETDYIERAKELISYIIDFFASNRELVELAHRGLVDKDRILMDMIRSEGKILLDSLKVFIELGVRTGRLKDFPAEYIIQIVLGMCAFHFISGELGKMIFGGKDLYSREVVDKHKDIVLDILLYGLQQNEGEK